MTAISGALKGFDGAPIADVVVKVYDNPAFTGKPLYVSERTGVDGKFIIQIDKEGTYFITVRAGYSGGRLLPGDILGVYGMDVPLPVTVKMKRVTEGIDITVGQVLDGEPE